MWYMSRIQSDSCAYTVAFGLRFQRALNVETLYAAIRCVCSSADVLRASFAEVDGQPRMLIAPALDFEPDIHRVDCDAADAAATLGVRHEAAAFHVFDLSDSSPPVWFELVVTGEGVEGLVVCQHHIITDGQSVHLLVRRLATAYAALIAGQTPYIRPSSFARLAQRGEMSDGLGGIEYWTRVLADAPPLSVPMSLMRPATQRFRGSSQQWSLSPELRKRLESLARTLKATPYLLVLALVGGFLGRLSEQDDFVVGSPHANRFDLESEDVLGLFVNSFGVRIGLAPELSLVSLVDRLRDQVLESFEYLNVSLEAVVDALKLERSLSYNPLFQVMVAYQSTMAKAPDFAGIASYYLPAHTAAARFDLEWTFFPEVAGGGFRLAWNQDLFEPASVKLLAQSFIAFADAWTRNSTQALQDVPILGSAPALIDESHSPPDIPADPKCLHELFQERARICPQNVALEGANGELWTYQQLDDASEQVADLLAERNLPAGGAVALMIERSPLVVIALIGIFKAGLVAVPMDPNQPALRWKSMLDDVAACCILTSHERSVDPDFGDLNPLPLDPAALRSPLIAAPKRAATSPDSIAYIIFTSGSTGKPKGVRVRHRNVVNTLRATGIDFGFTASDRVAVMAPVGFDIFFFEAFSPLMAGGVARLVSEEEWLNQHDLCAIFLNTTMFQAVPGMMTAILDALGPILPLEGMREVTTGGDRVPPDLLQRIADAFPCARITVTYGPTEAAIVATRFIWTGPVQGHPIGAPFVNVTIRVVDSRGNLCLDGVVGDILIGGAGVAEGYHNRPDETQAAFLLLDGQEFYATGDRGRWRPDGNLEFCGRRDNQIKIRGFRVELGEIECALERHPAVAQAVAVAREGEAGDATVAAFVTLAPGAFELADDPNGTAEWVRLFDYVHESDDSPFAGWNYSHDGRPISNDAMVAWQEATVAAIRDVVGRGLNTRPAVFEIGCGTGLILRDLAPDCSAYDATDISPAVVTRIRRGAELELGHVRIVCSSADTAVFPSAQYDIVVINSVSQYFPNYEYLRRVLALAIQRAAPSGQIFLGDVRALHLAGLFYDHVAALRVPNDPARAVGEASRLAAQEHELLVHPHGLIRLVGQLAPRARVNISPKRAGIADEITRFRFDAVIDLDPSGLIEVEFRSIPADWRSHLQRIEDDLVVGWKGLKNAWFEAGKDAVSPDEFVALANGLGLRASLSWLAGDALGRFDAVIWRGADRHVHPNWPAPHTLAKVATNQPAQRDVLQRLDRSLRSHAKAALPSYMVPSSIDILHEIPLTAHGKVDRRALPNCAPRQSRGDTVPLQGPIETRVAEVWHEILDLAELPSANANFFQLGGTSLSAIRVATRLRALGLRVAPQALFANQTLSELAASIADPEPTTPDLRPARRPSDWQVRTDRKRPPLEECGMLLLSGSTGFLGAHLLETLVRTTSATILCPVRAASDAAAADRLINSASHYAAGRWPDFPEIVAKRCIAFAADLANGPDTWSAYPLPGQADFIFHAAADVRHVASDTDMERSNVDAVHAVLSAAAHWNAAVHHVSSIGVAGVWASGGPPPTFRETDRYVGQTFTEGYSRSKWRAEEVLADFVGHGGTASIYRSSTIAPHSVTSRFQTNLSSHFLTRFIASSIELGFALARPQAVLSLVPVDVMADWIVGLAAGAEPSCFHLMSRHRLSYLDILCWLKAAGYRIEILTQREFEAAVGSVKGTIHEAALGGVFKSSDLNGSASISIDATMTHLIMDNLNLTDPRPTAEWFAKFAAMMAYENLIPNPPA
jgi:amino acid adenylation domain-containing protein/thioester reductase-like protein